MNVGKRGEERKCGLDNDKGRGRGEEAQIK